MLYKKYPLYDSTMEIMLPSSLIQVGKANDTEDNPRSKRLGDSLFAQYAWVSENRRVVVNVTKGFSAIGEDNLADRVQDYYSIYKRDVLNFKCISILRKRIYGKYYGEMVYTSEMMGHDFYNIFVIGEFQDGEIIITLQCLLSEKDKYEKIFPNIVDSIKINSSRQIGE